MLEYHSSIPKEKDWSACFDHQTLLNSEAIRKKTYQILFLPYLKSIGQKKHQIYLNVCAVIVESAGMGDDGIVNAHLTVIPNLIKLNCSDQAKKSN